MNFSIVYPNFTFRKALDDIVYAMFWSLKALKHNVEIREDFNTSNQIILFGAHSKHVLKNHIPNNNNIIIYNTEQYNWWITDEYTALLSNKKVWSIFNDNLGTYVPVSYVKELENKHIPQKDREIDILFYGSSSTHRVAVLLELSKYYRICYLGYTDLKDNFLRKSKVVLSINYNDLTDKMAVARLIVPLHSGIVAAAEFTTDKKDWPASSAISSIDDMDNLIKDYKKIGEHNKEKFKKHPMTKYIEKALDNG